MPPEKHEQEKLNDLLQENQRLLVENNQLLNKLYSRLVWAFWLKILWLFILFGAPVALYYYVLEPYFYEVSESVLNLNSGLENIPGWSQFIDAITFGRSGGE